jgi:hypothetical protein
VIGIGESEAPASRVARIDTCTKSCAKPSLGRSLALPNSNRGVRDEVVASPRPPPIKNNCPRRGTGCQPVKKSEISTPLPICDEDASPPVSPPNPASHPFPTSRHARHTRTARRPPRQKQNLQPRPPEMARRNPRGRCPPKLSLHPRQPIRLHPRPNCQGLFCKGSQYFNRQRVTCDFCT